MQSPTSQRLQLPENFAGFALTQSYRRLPEAMYREVSPGPAPAPRGLLLNAELCRELGLDADALQAPEGTALLAGAAQLSGAAPLALAYSGHQFGHFNPTLGDGRALLLGTQPRRSGGPLDIQLKGAGTTPFSRNGDGRAALGPVLREYLMSEAMAALGVPTTRALAAVATGAPVYRETALPGAVLTRVSSSQLRIGSFEYAAAHLGTDTVKALADYTIAEHYPQLQGADDPYAALLEAVTSAQARLVAQWMLIGFVHGVMNTDNMSIAGETIDYGPCAFIDRWDPAAVFSSIDRDGRYAFGRQPAIALWNLARLAETLLPLLHTDSDKAVDSAHAALAQFGTLHQTAFDAGLLVKLGLPGDEGDLPLAQAGLDALQASKLDAQHFFSQLTLLAGGGDVSGKPALERADAGITAWLGAWRQRVETLPLVEVAQRMQSVNPVYLPRNYWVEWAINAAYQGDLQPLEQLLEATREPFSRRDSLRQFEGPPPAFVQPFRTFCGT